MKRAAAMSTLLGALAHAHVADEIAVRLDPQAMTQTITLTADTLARLAPVDADSDGELTQQELDARAEAIRLGVWEQARLEPCTRSNEAASLEPGFVSLTARFDCPPGPLRQEFKWLLVLPPNYRVLFGGQVARGELRTVHLSRAAPPPAAPARGRAFWALAAAAVGAIAACFRRARVPGVALAATALGFWLVVRLLT